MLRAARWACQRALSRSNPARAGLLLAAMMLPGAPALGEASTETSVAFRPSSTSDANPERGFYRPARTTLERLDRADADDAFAHGYRLLYVRIDLGPYRTTDLPAPFLARLEEGLVAARQSGVKLIVRATYNYPQGETGYQSAQDAALPQVLSHINALGPVLRRNADVIAFVQAGFIGAWGEWHTSSNGLAAPEPRTRIESALLAEMPANRFVQFRYPPYLQEWAPTLPKLDAALSGAFRWGFHNDCFLASQTDVGTYSPDAAKRSAQLRYIAALGALGPFGAETCKPADEAGAVPRPQCAAILDEGARLHLTYLNDAYYRPLFHDRWVADGCMDEVRARMGYRFELLRVTLPRSVRAGSTLPVRISIRNTGWARAYNPRSVELVLIDRSGRSVARSALNGIDPRAWRPGETAAATAEANVPATLPPGDYSVAIALPDPSPTLHDDPRYAIRPANADWSERKQRWDGELGAFITGMRLAIL